MPSPVPRVQTTTAPNAITGKLDVGIVLDDAPYRFVFHLDDGRKHVIVTGVSVELTDPAGPLPIPPAVLRELADRYLVLESHALAEAQTLGKMVGADLHVRPAYRHRKLTPEFLAGIQQRHAELSAAGLAPTQTIAKAEGVSTGAVKHWLRQARSVNGRRRAPVKA